MARLLRIRFNHSGYALIIKDKKEFVKKLHTGGPGRIGWQKGPPWGGMGRRSNEAVSNRGRYTAAGALCVTGGKKQRAAHIGGNAFVQRNGGAAPCAPHKRCTHQPAAAGNAGKNALPPAARAARVMDLPPAGVSVCESCVSAGADTPSSITVTSSPFARRSSRRVSRVLCSTKYR